MNTQKPQSGFTLIEILAALAITSILMIAGVQLSDIKNQDITDQNTAQYHAMINSSAIKYVQSISSSIESDVTVNLINPRVINFNQIRTAGFIPNQFQNATTNPYGQTPCVFAYKDPANPKEISLLVVSEGGEDIPIGRAPSIATMIGSSGGYIPVATPNTAVGSYGKWTKSIPNLNCSGQRADENHIASQVYFDGSDLTQNYLYRSEVPGHPEANEMNTPLVMNAESTKDDVCTKLGSISRSSTGSLLTCSGTTPPYKWNSSESDYWKSPVDSFSQLNLISCSSSNSGETRVVKSPTVGSGPRAYSCENSLWSPLAIDDSGSLFVSGELRTSSLNVTDTATINKLNGELEITSIANENDPCPKIGRIARDAVGLILSCQDFTWKKAQGGGAPESGSQEFIANGIWVAPSGVTQAKIILIGGAGGAGGNYSGGGAGTSTCFGSECAAGGSGSAPTFCSSGPNGTLVKPSVSGEAAYNTGGVSSNQGAPGQKVIKYITVIPSTTYNVTVGVGGGPGSGPCSPGRGAPGVAFIEY